MVAEPRFGLIPAPIELLDKTVDGEVLVNRSNGHIYLKNSGKSISKTVENEKRITQEEIRGHHISNNLILGSGDWSSLIEVYTGKIDYRSINNRMRLSRDTSTEVCRCTIDNFINISHTNKYNLSIDIQGSAGNITLQPSLVIYDNKFNRLSSTILSSIKNPSGKYTIDFGECIGSEYKFRQDAAYMKLAFMLDTGASVDNYVSFNSIELNLISNYSIQSNILKNSYININANSPEVKGMNIGIGNSCEVFKSINILMPKDIPNTQNRVIHSINLGYLRYGLYSFVIRISVPSEYENLLTLRLVEVPFSKTLIEQIPITQKNIKKKSYYNILATGIDYSTDTNDVERTLKLDFAVNGTGGVDDKYIKIDYITISPANVGIFGFND